MRYVRIIPLIVFSIVTMWPVVCQALEYDVVEIVDLTDPSLHSGFEPVALNNHNVVVGNEEQEGSWHTSAFRWDSENGFECIGFLGIDNTTAQDINDNGFIVGYSRNADNHSNAFLWHEDMGMINLGTLGGNASFAKSINEYNEVAGYGSEIPWPSALHTFVWDEDNGFTDLMAGDTIDSHGFVINNLSTIAGTAYYANTSTGEQPCLWKLVDGTYQQIFLNMGDFDSGGTVHDLNDQEIVVGSIIFDAVLWDQNGDLQFLFEDPDVSSSKAQAINNQDQIVGRYQLSGGGYPRGYLYSETDGIQDLQDLLSPQSADYLIVDAIDINDNRTVLAQGIIEDQWKYVLLIPRKPYLCGDANGDGAVDINDLFELVNYAFAQGAAPVYLDRCDFNQTGALDISDIITLVEYLFHNGPEPNCEGFS